MALEPNRGFSEIFRAHVQGVRLFMRDAKELNLLIRGEESSDRSIAWATMDFVSDFNLTTPQTYMTLEDMYVRQWQSMAIRGTVVSVLQSLVILYARNHLPFSDGGISININDKAPLLMQILGFTQSIYEQNKRAVKTAMNIQQLLEPESTGLFSDYSALATLNGW